MRKSFRLVRVQSRHAARGQGLAQPGVYFTRQLNGLGIAGGLVMDGPDGRIGPGLQFFETAQSGFDALRSRRGRQIEQGRRRHFRFFFGSR
jgi:hypothetical protein